ncbi:uncharacterized protein LOC116805972 [Drosophila grimshawi]|uniref:uncharacterized protein LOC116805972 n=1 Tax=Drosophila grimshawi TaxID=7222 RepID=UPI0013EEF7A0|nr:uncharacterized protein LOC116805972 [Drosophila grimshawi]
MWMTLPNADCRVPKMVEHVKRARVQHADGRLDGRTGSKADKNFFAFRPSHLVSSPSQSHLVLIRVRRFTAKRRLKCITLPNLLLLLHDHDDDVHYNNTYKVVGLHSIMDKNREK